MEKIVEGEIYPETSPSHIQGGFRNL